MNSLQADLAKVKARSTALESTETAVLSSLIGRLEEVQQRLGNGSTTLPAALPGLLTAVQNGSGRMSDAVKEVHNPLNKLGKSIDKVCVVQLHVFGLYSCDRMTEILGRLDACPAAYPRQCCQSFRAHVLFLSRRPASDRSSDSGSSGADECR